MKNVAIIGAGISGLTLANLLKDHAQITIFEKARGVSGRMSTRRHEPYFFDHGAQYFTVRHQCFHDFLDPLMRNGIVKQWNPRYVKFDHNQIIMRKNWADDEPRYVGAPGMNQIAKYLAKDVNVILNEEIVLLDKENTWQLKSKKGNLYHSFDWVISTAPAPQSASLLPKTFKYQDEISKIKMTPCLCLMLGFSKSLSLEFEAAHVVNSNLSWLAVNSHKPDRKGLFSLVVHSSENYAQRAIREDDEKIIEELCVETSRLIGQDVFAADFKSIHRWRYANIRKKDPKKLFIDHDLKIAACGDWCDQGRVEGAFISAWNLVKPLKEDILCD